MMEMQSEVWTHEYHSMFHFGETEYDVYGVYLNSNETPEYFDIFNRVGECLNEGEPIYAEDSEAGPTLDQLVRFAE